MVKDRGTRERFSDTGPEITTLGNAIRERGLLTRANSIINLCPPLVINAEEVDMIVDAVDGALSDMEQAHGLA